MLRALETQTSVRSSNDNRLSFQIHVWVFRAPESLALKHLQNLAERSHDLIELVKT
jgi:hypothetical protein